jgi:rod shape-determining protein MreC
MNKEYLSYIFILIALFIGAIYYNSTIQSPIINSLNNIKISYHNFTENISSSIDKYFFQANKITQLEKQLKQYQNNHLVMQQLASEINDLYKENNSSLKLNPKAELSRVISYEKFGNFNRLWIDISDYNSSKIYGLTYKELVAGIVVPEENKALALLNKDIKSAYSVFIGKNKAPAIVHGNNDKYLVANFIPAWVEINIGDEIVTSGLDNIFFKGLKVGKVVSISSGQGYQTAVVDPYYKSNEANYFHIIRSVK